MRNSIFFSLSTETRQRLDVRQDKDSRRMNRWLWRAWDARIPSIRADWIKKNHMASNRCSRRELEFSNSARVLTSAPALKVCDTYETARVGVCRCWPRSFYPTEQTLPIVLLGATLCQQHIVIGSGEAGSRDSTEIYGCIEIGYQKGGGDIFEKKAPTILYL